MFCAKIFKSVRFLLFLSSIVGGASEELDHDIGALLQSYIDRGQVAGANVVVVHKGERVSELCLGYADIQEERPMARDTIFRIASLTKNYSALLVKSLEEAGKLSVGDRVDHYLPYFKGVKYAGQKTDQEVDLRIWHLMSHTSGVITPVGYKDAESLESAARLLCEEGLAFQPGSQWSYGKGMDIVGRIIEVVSGVSFEDYLNEVILSPMGFSDTSYSVPQEKAPRLAVVYKPTPSTDQLLPINGDYYAAMPYKARKPNPSAGLYATATEVADYYTMLRNGGVWNGEVIISEPSLTDLTRVWTGEMDTNPISGFGWGLGFGVVRDVPKDGVTAMLSVGTYGHGGYYGPQAWVDPEQDIIYILMIQRLGFGNGDMSQIREDFQRVVAKHLID